MGGDEAEAQSVTWRRYCVKEQLAVPLDKAIDAICSMREQRMMDNFSDVNIPIDTQ